MLINQKNTAKEVGDEAIELFNALNVPIVACQNRVAGAHYLYQHCQPDIIISDDGLSHLALSRDRNYYANR